VLLKQTLALAIVEKGAQGCLGSSANLVQPEEASTVRYLIKHYITTQRLNYFTGRWNKLFSNKMYSVFHINYEVGFFFIDEDNGRGEKTGN
jgi:hypothetical protein